MGMDKQKLLGQRSLSDFEKRWLADRNIDHPALQDVPEPHAVGDPNDAVDDGDVSDDVPDLPPYEDMTVPDLKADAASRGLAQSGTKAELIARLQAHDDENSPE